MSLSLPDLSAVTLDEHGTCWEGEPCPVCASTQYVYDDTDSPRCGSCGRDHDPYGEIRERYGPWDDEDDE